MSHLFVSSIALLELENVRIGVVNSPSRPLWAKSVVLKFRTPRAPALTAIVLRQDVECLSMFLATLVNGVLVVDWPNSKFRNFATKCRYEHLVT